MRSSLQIARGKGLPLRSFLLSMVLSALSFSLFAQVPQQRAWDKTFGGSEDDMLRSIVVTSDGGYLLAGGSESNTSGEKTEPSRGQTDYWVVRIDAAGNKHWDKTFGGSNSDNLHAAVSTPDGGFLLVGYSQSGISGDKTQAGQGTWLVKIQSNGSKHWDKVLTANSYTAVFSVSGGYVLAGYTELAGGFLLTKIDLSGNKLWEKTYGTGGAGSTGRVIATATADGGFLLASIVEASGGCSIG